jgi:hypothetical protein
LKTFHSHRLPVKLLHSLEYGNKLKWHDERNLILRPS